MKHNGLSKSWRKIQSSLRLKQLSPPARKIIVGVVGTLVLLAGVAMIVLPGPAIIFIPLGFAILATEFQWAKQAWRKVRNKFKRTGSAAGSK